MHILPGMLPIKIQPKKFGTQDVSTVIRLPKTEPVMPEPIAPSTWPIEMMDTA